MPRLIPPPAGLLLALATALPAAVIAAPAAPAAVPGCVARPAAGAAPSPPPAALDYAALNRLLLNPEVGERLSGLPGAIDRLARSRAPEVALVRPRLQLALAQAQAGSGHAEAAIATLKQLPLDSAQAPEALQLLAELEVARARPAAARRWLQQLAELFPDDARAVQALLRAAELAPDTALADLQRAVALADQGREAAQHWLARSHDADFMDDVEALPPALWRLAKATLTDREFARADAAQVEAGRQLQCLASLQQARAQLQQDNPRLLADLTATVDALDEQLETARAGMPARERRYLEAAAAWKACGRQRHDCAPAQAERDRLGRDLTGWRNRLRDLEQKRDYLHASERRLAARWQREQAATVAAEQRLADRRGEEHALMKWLLQDTLAAALDDREALVAEARFRLAAAQEIQVRTELKAAPRQP